MAKDTHENDPIAEVVAELCPDLDAHERTVAEENLRRYMALVARMAERMAREAMERDGTRDDSQRPDIPW